MRGLSSSLPYASKHHVALNAPRHCERRFLFQEPHVRRLLARAPQMHTRASRRNQWLAANLAARLVVPPAAQRSGQAATLLAAEIAGAGVCSGASALVSSVAICMCPSLFNLRIFVSSNFQIPLCFLSVNRKGVSGACSPGDLQRLPFFLGIYRWTWRELILFKRDKGIFFAAMLHALQNAQYIGPAGVDTAENARRRFAPLSDARRAMRGIERSKQGKFALSPSSAERHE